jgi:hypothetical protein
MNIGKFAKVTAGDKGGMTVADLRLFLTALDQMEVADDTIVYGQINWHGAVKSLRAVGMKER